MTKQQAINYLRSSGFSEEQIRTVVKAIENDYQERLERHVRWLMDDEERGHDK